MRRLSCLVASVLILVAGVFFSASSAFGQNVAKVLMIPREGYSSDLDLMLKMEVGVMTLLLKQAGFQVDVATTSGQPILGPTQRVENVLRLSEIRPEDYAGIIMPCMAVGMFPGPPVSAEAVAVVKTAVQDGKPVAAAANASVILAEAGLLKGKQYAYLKNPLTTDANWKRTDRRYEGGDL